MYKPKSYARLMEYATTLRALHDRRGGRTCPSHQTNFLVRRIVVRLDNLLEHAYLIGHDEGFVDGKGEGIMEGKDEANCHRVKDEEWEYALQ